MPKIIAHKEDWIKLGHQLFSEKGMAGIVVEKMAKQLACNKSSFYWHFKTRKVFLDAIIEYWVNLETAQIIILTDQETTSEKRFMRLTELAFKQKPNLDFIFYLKRYALKDKKILKLIEDIDQQRTQFVATLLLEIGFSESEAKIKSRLYYKFLIGYHEMIRYRKQKKGYMKEVMEEMTHFIKM